ncbi:MAG: polysaccharide deacetylase family protein [Candidatus Krumholzibacteria bacterium]|nr:polysaccharide deacetylase family protein [Candidatus Krumholzibacteria bacterium]
MTAVFQASALIILAVAALYAFWRSRWGYPGTEIPGVLTYHKIVDFEFGGTWISPRRFEKHIVSLIDSGYTFIDEGTFLETIEGTRPAGEKEILLTFDDGYECVAQSAAPVLERLRVPALVFLVSRFAGEENSWELGLPGRKARHMDWETVNALRSLNFSFGSHCESHLPLTRMTREEALGEMVRSKEEIERRTGTEVLSLSYPFGRTDPETALLAAEAGYSAAFTLYPSGTAAETDRFRLRREGVWVIDTPASTRVKLSRGGLFWLEDIKGRMINAVADLTPLLKKK